MDNLHVVTIATHNDGYYDALIESGKRNGINVKTLGWGQKWKGFTMKFELINNYLNNINEDDIVVFVDAYDVIILENKEEILNRFYDYSMPIILSVDNAPEIPIIRYFYNKIFDKCENYNINSGLYIGYVWALKKMFKLLCDKNMCTTNQIDDQVLLVNVCRNKSFYKKYINIDNDYKIFFNTFGTNNSIYEQDLSINKVFNINNNKFKFKGKNYGPCFIHGPNDTNFDEIIDFYDLPKKVVVREPGHRFSVYTKPFYHKFLIDDIQCIFFIIFIGITLFIINKIRK